MVEDEEPPEEKAIGPKCAICGQSTDSLYPLLMKREIRGMYEMVQIYLCAIHFMERLEEGYLPPPPEDEEENDEENWKKFMGPDKEDDEEEPDDQNKCNVDHQGQSWG